MKKYITLTNIVQHASDPEEWFVHGMPYGPSNLQEALEWAAKEGWTIAATIQGVISRLYGSDLWVQKPTIILEKDALPEAIPILCPDCGWKVGSEPCSVECKKTIR